MYTVHEINALSPEEHAALYSELKRQAAKKFLAFVAIKLVIYGAIAYSVKKANSMP